MRRELTAGLAAGAVGTVALNAATYLDMAFRGRPSSSMPADAAEKLGDTAGADFGDEDTAPNRKEGIGALLGILTGLGVGAVHGLVRSRFDVPAPVAAVGLGLGAMAGSDLPMFGLGLTDPREWDAASWASDVVPHLAYGVAAAAAYELFEGGSR